ncbi:hypothetical protein LEMLEM_LOCUS12280 [Lemmus lemmus]
MNDNNLELSRAGLKGRHTSSPSTSVNSQAFHGRPCTVDGVTDTRVEGPPGREWKGLCRTDILRLDRL